MNSRRKIAAIVGGLYLLTFVTSIPALVLKRSFLSIWSSEQHRYCG